MEHFARVGRKIIRNEKPGNVAVLYRNDSENTITITQQNGSVKQQWAC